MFLHSNKYLIKKIVTVFILQIVFFIKFPTVIEAASYYWVGGSTDSDMSNPANWRTAPGACADSENLSVPGLTDGLYFVSNCTNSASLNDSMSVSSLNMQNGYTGSVNINSTNLLINGSLYVSTGTLNLLNGGTLSSNLSVISTTSDTLGVVNVDGVESQWTITGQLRVGDQGEGELNITNGGKVTSSTTGISAVIVGNGSNSLGTISIDGSGSNFTNSGTGRVRIGGSGNGNMSMQNGGTADIGYIYVAYGLGSNGEVIIDGSGTVLNTDKSGGLGYIGREGNGVLTIKNGGVLNTNASPWQIGGVSAGVGTVTVTGIGSELNFLDDSVNLRVGYSGNGTLNINNGGEVNNTGPTSKTTVADQPGSIGTINIGSGYNMDLLSSTEGVFTGSGTASLPPSAPLSISGKAVSNSAIYWDWEDINNANGYRLYDINGNLLATTNESSWTQESLASSSTQYLTIRGFNGNGIGYASDQLRADTFADIAPDRCNININGQSDLFQINRSGEIAKLFFTPTLGDVKNYNVIYGFSEGDERFGVSLPIINNNEGVQSIDINKLHPNFNYFFKVIPVNGCAAGEWSKWLQSGKGSNRTTIFYKYTFNNILPIN